MAAGALAGCDGDSRGEARLSDGLPDGEVAPGISTDGISTDGVSASDPTTTPAVTALPTSTAPATTAHGQRRRLRAAKRSTEGLFLVLALGVAPAACGATIVGSVGGSRGI